MARQGEEQSNVTNSHYVIDITSRSEASTSTTHRDAAAAASGGLNTRNSTSMTGEDGGRRQRNPLDSMLWISVELLITIGQIVAFIVVLCLSRDEHPDTPLYVWIIGYVSGCVVTLPLFFWRYYHNHCASEEDLTQQNQIIPRINDPLQTPFPTARMNREGEVQITVVGSSRSNLMTSWMMSARLKMFMSYFKLGIDCFFAIWFIIGVGWILRGDSFASDAPNLYRLCIAFISISFIGYATPFILCATICCCLPCIISFVGVREDHTTQIRGATSESINALPTYKFKMMKKRNSMNENNLAHGEEGGIVAIGTEKERMISGEDAVCCICLAEYENNDEIRELSCSHLFHKNCVDKWLKINALCPLCKSEVGETKLVSAEEDAIQQMGERSVENGHTIVS